MSDSTIRSANEMDIAAMAALWHEKMTVQQQSDHRFRLSATGQAEWSVAAADWLKDPCCTVLVADRDHEIVGYIIGRIEDGPPGMRPARIGSVIDLAVGLHSYQSGLGRRLLEPLREWFACQGITAFVARVPRRQPVDQAFWRAMGATELTDVLWMNL